MHALFALFSILNTHKDMRLQPLRRSRLFYFTIPRYSISLLAQRSPLSVLLLMCWFPEGANHHHFSPRWAGSRVANPMIRINTCIRSSGLPVGSHGIVGRRAQKSGHQLAASPYWITSSGITSNYTCRNL